MIRLHRPPKISLWLYLFGFILVMATFGLQQWLPEALPATLAQRVMILGAIVVCIGSMFSIVDQIKHMQRDKKHKSE